MEPRAGHVGRPDGTVVAHGHEHEQLLGQVIIDRILRNGDSAEARMLLGVTKLNVHDYPAALTDLAKAVELNPNLPDVYAFYGQALQATGDPGAATGAYRKALAANPNNFTANLELGVLLKDDQKLDEALDCLLAYGSSLYDHRGGEIVLFDKRAWRRLERADDRALLKRASENRGLYAVRSSDGQLVTVGHRYRRFPRD